MSQPKSVLLGIGVAVLVAGACSRKEQVTEAAAAPATVAPAAATPTAAPAATPAAAAIATADGRTPGTRAEVTELKRGSGGTVTLKLTLINDTSGTVSFTDLASQEDLFHAGDLRIGGVHMIDPVGKKKYFVVRDAEKKCVCSNAPVVQKGERVNLWAKFPAPPDDVERISIVLPAFAPLDDVPVSR